MNEDFSVERKQCSFCNELSFTIAKNGKYICTKCIHKANIAIGNIPKGAIQCMSCKSINGFVAIYGDALRVGFAKSGLDDEGELIYTIVATNRKWVKGIHYPEKLMCINKSCKKQIPLWMIEQNSYVREVHPKKD